MGFLKEFDQNNLARAGQDLHQLASELFPICRSITGDGIRKTLAVIGNRIPLRTFEVPTGTQVFDWTVPKEWNIRDAYVKAPDGTRVVDFQKSCLHVLNYSTPVHAEMRLSELKAHLFTIPEKPDWVPYRTSYYQENWGFCLSHNQMLALADGEYEVCIDSTLEDGHLTYGGMLSARPLGRRSADFLACLSSFAGERQPIRRRGGGVPCGVSGQARSSILLPVSVLARNDRRHYLAGPQCRNGFRDTSRSGARRSR